MFFLVFEVSGTNLGCYLQCFFGTGSLWTKFGMLFTMFFGIGSLWTQIGLLFAMFFWFGKPLEPNWGAIYNVFLVFEGFASGGLQSVSLETNFQIRISIEIGL